jgi:hypothetical protein
VGANTRSSSSVEGVALHPTIRGRHVGVNDASSSESQDVMTFLLPLFLGMGVALSMFGAASWVERLARDDEREAPDSLLYRPRFRTWS